MSSRDPTGLVCVCCSNEMTHDQGPSVKDGNNISTIKQKIVESLKDLRINGVDTADFVEFKEKGKFMNEAFWIKTNAQASASHRILL